MHSVVRWDSLLSNALVLWVVELLSGVFFFCGIPRVLEAVLGETLCVCRCCFLGGGGAGEGRKGGARGGGRERQRQREKNHHTQGGKREGRRQQRGQR